MLEPGFYWYQSHTDDALCVVKIDAQGDMHIPGVIIPFSVEFALTRGVLFSTQLVFPKAPKLSCKDIEFLPNEHYFFYLLSGEQTVVGISEFGDALFPGEDDYSLSLLCERGMAHFEPIEQPDILGPVVRPAASHAEQLSFDGVMFKRRFWIATDAANQDSVASFDQSLSTEQK